MHSVLLRHRSRAPPRQLMAPLHARKSARNRQLRLCLPPWKWHTQKLALALERLVVEVAVVVLALPVGAGNEEAATAEAGVMGVVVAWARALSKYTLYS